MLNVHNVSTWVLETEPWDFLAISQPAIHQFGKDFMTYHPPQLAGVNDDDFAIYRDVMTRVYCFHDAMLGRLLELAGHETTVLICSDQGLARGQDRPRANRHRPRTQGMFVMAGPGVRPTGRIHGATILDITPTILRLFGLANAADMDGRALGAGFDHNAETDVIESWDRVSGDAGMSPASVAGQPTDSAHSIRHLLEMGYVEEQNARAEKLAAKARDQSTYNRAVMLLGTGRHEQAVDLLEPLWRDGIEDARRGYCLALGYLFLGRYEACKRIIEEVLAHLESTHQQRISRVTRYRLRAAELGPQRIAEAESGTHPDGINDVEVAAERSAKVDERLARIEDQLRQHDATAIPRLQLLQGVLALTEKRTEDAARLFESVEELSNNSPSQLIQIGNAYLRMRCWKPAQKAFGRTLELDPHSAPAHNGLAAALIRLRHTELAMEHLFTSAELLPDNPYTHFLLGVGFSRLGSPDQAEQAFLAAINLAPGLTGPARSSRCLPASAQSRGSGRATARGNCTHSRATRSIQLRLRR